MFRKKESNIGVDHTSISDMPGDVFKTIGGYLPPQDAVNFSRVNKNLHTLLSTASFWQMSFHTSSKEDYKNSYQCAKKLMATNIDVILMGFAQEKNKFFVDLGLTQSTKYPSRNIEIRFKKYCIYNTSKEEHFLHTDIASLIKEKQLILVFPTDIDDAKAQLEKLTGLKVNLATVYFLANTELLNSLKQEKITNPRNLINTCEHQDKGLKTILPKIIQSAEDIFKNHASGKPKAQTIQPKKINHTRKMSF